MDAGEKSFHVTYLRDIVTETYIGHQKNLTGKVNYPALGR